MTFDEFKALALNQPYIDRQCVYRVDMHRYIKRQKDAKDVTEFEVRLCQSFMYTDWQSVQKRIPYFIHGERYNEQLYALYIYELPLNCDVSCDQYQRLWVYDRNGNLSARSMCSTLLEELGCQCAKFRGHDSGSVLFNPGDIVEVYDHRKDQVRLGVVIKQPPTIEQCWDMRNEVKKACIAEGVGVENTDDNYWLYGIDDCYCVMLDQDFDLSYPCTTDVFSPTYPISDRLRQRFAEYYRLAIECYSDKISFHKITEHTTSARIRKIRFICDRL